LKAARRLQNIAPFKVMELLARANELGDLGHDVIHLEVGEPDFPTPGPILRAAEKSLKDGQTRYTDARVTEPGR
jgi:aspartate/methionine/tyrosine aminotransferase